MQILPVYDITKDDLGKFGQGPALVTDGKLASCNGASGI